MIERVINTTKSIRQKQPEVNLPASADNSDVNAGPGATDEDSSESREAEPE